MGTKSDLIRECVALDPDATNQEIKQYCAQRGVSVDSNLLCAVVGPESKRLVSHRLDATMISQARQFIRNAGGTKQAKNIVDIVAKDYRYV